MRPRQKHRRLTAIAAAVLGLAAAASAEDVVVKLSVANILTGKTAGSDRVAQMKRGEKLQVIAHEGSWLKVKVGDKEGYVHENSVTGSESKDGLKILKAAGGDSNASQNSAGLAGRGVGEASAWAKTTGKSEDGLNRMLELRETIQGSDWKKFTAEGNVGEGRK